MKPPRACLMLVAWCLLAGGASPGDRQATDPRTLASPANPEAAPVPIEDVFFSRRVFGPAWSPDGKEVAFTTNFTGRYNLWKVPAAGGWPTQLSRSENVEAAAAWSPDGRWIVFQQDQAGDGLYNLFAVPGSGGAAVNLSNTREVSESNPRWSPDGSLLCFVRKPKTSSIRDLALLDWRTRAARSLTRETDKNHSWSFAAWSPDGKALYANRANASFLDSDVYRIDLATGALANLTPHQGERRYVASSVSPDGLTLLITANAKGGYENVALLDVAGRKLTWVTDLQWEAQSGGFSPDGRSFTYSVNEDGREDVYLADRATGKAARIDFPAGWTTPTGHPTAFSPAGDRLLLSHQDSRRPADLWIYDLRTRQAGQLTFSSLASLQPSRIPASRLVHYQSFDGTMISAFLWIPFNLQRDGTNPGVVLAHGGPTGQTVDIFDETVIALASRGYAVIAPNVRGSTGYGTAFEKANYKDLGGGDLQDYVYGARFLAATGYVDAGKIGITGGSYGGFMAMMAIGKTPDAWAAAVELFGITDWLTEQQHEDPQVQQYDQSKLGDPVKDREVYEKASPIRYFRFARAPLLVLQGANDIIDPQEEAEQAVKVLERAGKVVDSHYYPDEGHGFNKRENEIDALRRTVEWFDRYLKGAPRGGAGAAPGGGHGGGRRRL
jgi:dipeptidyl aminopeptidase/acylaminoacyl peptidase